MRLIFLFSALLLLCFSSHANQYNVPYDYTKQPLSYLYKSKTILPKSFAKKHYCFRELLIKGERYAVCHPSKYNKKTRRMDKKFLYGLIKQKKNSWANAPTWAIKPKYEKLYILGDGHVYRKKKKTEKLFEKYNLLTKEKSKSDIVEYIAPSSLANSLARSHTYVFTKNQNMLKDTKGHYHIVDEHTGAITKSIVNADPDTKTEYGKLAPFYTLYNGGFLGRFLNEDGSKFYQVLSSKGEPTSPKFPEGAIIPISNHGYTARKNNYSKSILFFVNLDEDYYWPILYDKDKYYEKPDHVVGALKESYPYWTHIPPEKRTTNIEATMRLNVVHTDGFVYVKKFLVWSLGADFYKAATDKKTNLYLKAKSYLAHDGIDVTNDGFKYSRRFYILEKTDGTFVTLKYNENWHKKKDPIKDLPTALAMIDLNTEAADSIANNKIQSNKEHEARLARSKAQYERKYQEYRAREKAYQQSVKAHNAAIRKNRRNAVWSNVSRQLSQSAEQSIKDSKARTKCIRKRAKSKQAYADGKQNWYYEGGCN